jgi:hypothetical protein
MSRGTNSTPEARPRSQLIDGGGPRADERVPRLLEEPAPSARWMSRHLLLAGNGAGPRTNDRAVADGSVFSDGAECRQLSDAADIELTGTADTECR